MSLDLPLLLLAALIPLIQAYSTPLIVPLLALAALAILAAGGWRRLDWRGQPAKWLALLFLALLALGAAGAAWAVEPLITLRTAARVAGLAACGLLLLRVVDGLDQDRRRRLVRFMVIGVVLGLVDLQVSLSTGGALRIWLQDALRPLIGAQRPLIMPNALDAAMTFLGLLVWPALLAVYRRWGRLAAAALFLAALGVVVQGFSLTAVIALLAGLLMGLLALLLPRRGTALLASLAAVWILAAPMVLQPKATAVMIGLVPPVAGKLSSFEHRRAIWGFVIERIAEKPMAGWGMGSSRAIPGGQTQIRPGVELLPLHPHDAALQLWLELGLPGAVLGAVFVLMVIRSIGRTAGDAPAYASAMALFAAAMVNAMASYNLWHEWWMTFLLLAALWQFAVTGLKPAGPQGP